MSVTRTHVETLSDRDVTRALPATAPPPLSVKRAYAQTFLSTAAIRVFGIASGILAARLLGPVGRGELAVIIFLPTLLMAVGGFSLPQAIAYEVGKSPEREAQHASTGFRLALASGFLQVLVFMPLLPAFFPTDKRHLLWTASWFMLYLPAVYAGSALVGVDHGRGRFGRLSLFQALPGASYVVAILLLWSLHVVSPSAFALGMLAAAVLTAAIRSSVTGRALFRERPRREGLYRLLRRGIGFHIPTLAGLALVRADMVLLVRLVPTEAIGLYAVAMALAVGHMGTAHPFVQVSFTAVAREPEPVQGARILARQFRFAQLAILGSCLAAGLLAPWIIRLAFGSRFAAAVPTAYFLVAATAFWGLAQVLEHGLRALGHPGAGIVSNSVGLAVLVAFGIPGCLRFGIAGMGATLLFAHLTNFAVLLCFCVYRFQVPWRLFWGLTPETLRELGQFVSRTVAAFVSRWFGDSQEAVRNKSIATDIQPRIPWPNALRGN